MHPSPHTPKPLVTIQLITETSHPACGQYGLFAAKKIPPHTLILDYIGEVHCDDRPDSDYDLSLYRTPDYISVGIDAQHAGNEARFINDYRGVKGKPNAAFQERRTDSGELRMSVWSGAEALKKGDELLVSYGKSWWRERQHEDATCDLQSAVAPSEQENRSAVVEGRLSLRNKDQRVGAYIPISSPECSCSVGWSLEAWFLVYSCYVHAGVA
ncbi:hypothetical protein VTO73DRAFT_943 [Trametes versicolor]